MQLSIIMIVKATLADADMDKFATMPLQGLHRCRMRI